MTDDRQVTSAAQVLRTSPFAATAPAIVSALLFGTASLVWLVAGRWLPGTRWVVVHLFTLGVLTTLIAAFTLHFATSFTGQGAPSDRRPALVSAIVLDASVVMLLVGRLMHGKVLLSLGTVGLLGVVGVNFLALRRARRNARAPRFVWIVRRYEDAHLAFLLAATLGTIVGIGAVSGGWYAGVRDAHLHLMILGWAGLTVLATLVVFGPALLRGRMQRGADERARTALRIAAAALLVAAGGLVVASGANGALAVAARAAATAGLLVYGWTVLVVATAVLQTARSSDRSSLRWPVFAATTWLPVGLALDVVVVATSQRRAFDAVGVILFIGALTQLILAVIMHVAPQLRRRDASSMEVLARRMERFVVARSALLNAGVLAVVVGIGGPILMQRDMGPVVRIGWAAIAVGILIHLAPVVVPLRPAVEHDAN